MLVSATQPLLIASTFRVRENNGRLVLWDVINGRRYTFQKQNEVAVIRAKLPDLCKRKQVVVAEPIYADTVN